MCYLLLCNDYRYHVHVHYIQRPDKPIPYKSPTHSPSPQPGPSPSHPPPIPKKRKTTSHSDFHQQTPPPRPPQQGQYVEFPKPPSNQPPPTMREAKPRSQTAHEKTTGTKMYTCTIYACICEGEKQKNYEYFWKKNYKRGSVYSMTLVFSNCQRADTGLITFYIVHLWLLSAHSFNTKKYSPLCNPIRYSFVFVNKISCSCSCNNFYGQRVV